MSGLVRSRQTARVPLPSPFHKVHDKLNQVCIASLAVRHHTLHQTNTPARSPPSHRFTWKTADQCLFPVPAHWLHRAEPTASYRRVPTSCPALQSPWTFPKSPPSSQKPRRSAYCAQRGTQSRTGLDAGCLSSSSCYLGRPQNFEKWPLRGGPLKLTPALGSGLTPVSWVTLQQAGLEYTPMAVNCAASPCLPCQGLKL